MNITVIFSNNNSIYINENTYIYAWRSIDKNSRLDGYCTEKIFEGTWNDNEKTQNSDKIVFLQELFGNSDWFAIDDLNGKIYKTSSIVSLELF